MFLPSGRVHALGAGLVVFEIQQNSDTTYRVFDWNRLGLDGKPRDLHILESLASIDFKDFEPSLLPSAFVRNGAQRGRALVRDPLFTVEAHQMDAGANMPLRPNKLQIIALVAGQVEVREGQGTLVLAPGQYCLVPASLAQVVLHAKTTAIFLRVEA
jgi:mannose-6-phosphate isomerase